LVSCSLWSCFSPVLMFSTAVSRAACNRYCTAGPPPPYSCLSSDLFLPIFVYSWIKVERSCKRICAHELILLLRTCVHVYRYVCVHCRFIWAESRPIFNIWKMHIF
jgi:hypothetical protein